MKKIILLILVYISFISCSNESVKCDGYYEKETVKSIFKDMALKKKYAFQVYGMKNVEAYIDHFFKDNVEFELIRTTAQNKELKSCECAAKLTFHLKPEIQKKIDNIKQKNATNENEMIENAIADALLSNAIARDGIDIVYNIQETTDGNIVAESYDIFDQLAKVIFTFYTLERNFMNDYKKGTILIYKDKEGGDGKYTLKFIEKDKIEITYRYSDYIEKETVKYKDGRIIVSNLPKDFPILKDRIYLLEAEQLKVFNPESDNYDVYVKQ
jgi:predicted transcriptional regulator